jgi:hypothetical protein
MMAPGDLRMLVAKHGTVRSQDSSEWTGEFPLPPQLAKFYVDIGPVDVSIQAYGNPFFLPALSRLWQFQAGYRWDSITNKRIKDWDDDWLVVGDQGGDPLIFLRTSGEVLFAMHGTGTWEPESLFENVNIMTACLATLGDIVTSSGQNFTDEASYIRPAHRARAEQELSRILGGKRRVAEVLGALGWG